MNLENILTEKIKESIQELYHNKVEDSIIQLQKTRKEFEGDITLVVFPFLRYSKKSPEQTGEEVGEYLKNELDIISSFNVIKGFLNLTVSDRYYLQYLNDIFPDVNYGMSPAKNGDPVYMVEYSSPNTNKPLHLGHIRNNLLGFSVSEILKATGKHVVKTNIVNDRGIHICKSMLAWQKWGNGETPQSSGKKGDHLVGDYYVKFDQEYKQQIREIMSKGETEETAARNAPLIIEAQEMLRKWEAGDQEVVGLWKEMNSWVYEGFDETYRRLGVDFDKIYYESETYLVGKETVLKGLKEKILIQKEDTSVWADLTGEGLDEKILLRSDGTSVYMTQDIGTAQLRQNDYHPDKMIYVVGNEQNYHFKVLSIILDKLGFNWAKDLYHLSYGMVELPEGKMKSREGTVVDADDLMDEMVRTAWDMSKELGKLEGLTDDEIENIVRIIGLGALKYFILKVDPVKNMTFDPKESIDFNGNTGPFIQYTYARIQSIKRKADDSGVVLPTAVEINLTLNSKEKSLLKLIYDFPSIVRDAANNFSPALIANYVYDLVKEYNQFYHDYSILKEKKTSLRDFRLVVSDVAGRIINTGMSLLGIEVPDRM